MSLHHIMHEDIAASREKMEEQSSVSHSQVHAEALIQSLNLNSKTTEERRDLTPDPNKTPTLVTRSFTVGDVATDVWVQLFDGMISFGLSQLEGGRIGNYLLGETVVSALDHRTKDFVPTCLLGSRTDPLLPVFLRQLSEALYKEKGSYPTVLLGISVLPQSKSPAMFRALIEILVSLYQEAVAG